MDRGRKARVAGHQAGRRDPPFRERRADGPNLLTRIFLPFALGYFFSYLLRTINAIIAPDLVDAFGLSAADLGLLTSVYFLAFTLSQPLLGVFLDRFGPRRVEGYLLLLAAALPCAALFARLMALGPEDPPFDAALIELDCSVQYSTNVRPVALPKASDSLQNSDGTIVYIAGWGRTRGAMLSSR